MRTGEACRALDVGRARVGPGERDVAGERVVEQERVLEHDADRVAQLGQAQVADVDAVEADGAVLDVVEPVVEARQQPATVDLPLPVGADQRDRTAPARWSGRSLEHRCSGS